jgi:hypothetical protein
MDAWQFVAERKIEEAMDQGAFEHLEGAGEPLDLREDPLIDPSLRMAHRILKNNGFAPAWIEESKDIEAEIHRLRDRIKLSPEEFRGRAAALNRRILVFNLKAPSPSVHKRPMTVSESESQQPSNPAVPQPRTDPDESTN